MTGSKVYRSIIDIVTATWYLNKIVQGQLNLIRKHRRIIVLCFLFTLVVCGLLLLNQDETNKTKNEHLESNRHNSLQLSSAVHIAFVVDNMTSTITLIKSVLIHRTSLLYFHFLVSDDTSDHILHTLMKSWDLRYVEYSVYSIHELTKDMSWIPGDKMNDVVKLHLPSVLPKSLEKVLVLDNQLIAIGDVLDVWNLFSHRNINGKPIVISGIDTAVDNQPIHDVGAIIMYNLDSLHNYDIEWRQILDTTRSSTATSILNNIIKEFPNIHALLPCKLIEDCDPSTRDKDYCSAEYDSNDITNAYFVSLYSMPTRNCKTHSRYYELQMFVNEHDSVSLRKFPVNPRDRGPQPALFMCDKLKQAANSKFITRLFYIGGYYKQENQYETTIVTQLTISRLETFVKLMKHWTGPASITVYGKDSEIWFIMQFLKRYEFAGRQNIAIHFVIKQGMFYPINYLRNIALSNVKTKYVFLDDADFLPSFDMHEKMKLYNKHLLNSDKKRALVIPAFNTRYTDIQYPSDKAYLLKLIDTNQITRYCSHWTMIVKRHHAPTRYNQWYHSLYPYEIDWANSFEPYVVVRSDVVKYNETFMGYGWNKISQITELKAQGYQFIVIPDSFVVHIPHEESGDKGLWTHGSFKYCLIQLHKKFIKDLKHKYGANSLDESQQANIVFDDIMV